MAKTLKDFIKEDVTPLKDKSFAWLSNNYFFRDPKRPTYLDPNYFFSPADGIIIYQKFLKPDEPLIEIKGVNYTLKEALQDPDFNEECYVIGIFMTFYHVHINRIPYSGFLKYENLEKIKSHNYPMINEENKLLRNILDFRRADYMFYNQRVLNTIFSPKLKQHYYVLQMADLDVDCIVPFTLEQNYPFYQNERFGQIRWGSQVDLIIPKSKFFDFKFLLETGMSVEGGLDKLIKVLPKKRKDVK